MNCYLVIFKDHYKGKIIAVVSAMSSWDAMCKGNEALADGYVESVMPISINN